MDKEKLVDWVLRTVTIVGLGVGAWYFSGVNENVSSLTTAVNGLSTRLEVNDNERQHMLDDVQALAAEVKAIREEQVKRTGSVENVIKLSERVAAAEALLAERTLVLHDHETRLKLLRTEADKLQRASRDRVFRSEVEAWIDAAQREHERRLPPLPQHGGK